MEKLYQERLRRYVTAMLNEKPDMVPIRPFVAEFIAKYAGYTCQEVTHDFQKAFDATRKCAKDFDWDATVSNMVYVWTGLTEAIGLKYYGVPGIQIPADTGFQYIEPPEDQAWMKADEYDTLIEDPTGFLYNVWLPRVSKDVLDIGKPSSYRSNLSFVKGAMSMMVYFNAFGTQNTLLREESGTVSAIAGILKAPFDILADKLRGYIGLTLDMFEQPDKVKAACEALMPHLYDVALKTADPDKNVPVGFWMHRGCIPFVSEGQFESHYWPTLKPIIEELWRQGHQTLFYAEGNWNAHLESFLELPERSIVYHVDRDDVFDVSKRIGHRFCLSGGVPNFLMSFGKPQEVKEYCRKVIEGVAQDGGYIMDASAIMQNDTSIENLKAMTEATREFGICSSGSSSLSVDELKEAFGFKESPEQNYGLMGYPQPNPRPGVCIPWETKREELPKISGDEKLLKRIWEDIDALGNMYIWQCLLSF